MSKKRLRREVQIQMAPCGCGHEFSLVFYSTAGESLEDDRLAWAWVEMYAVQTVLGHTAGKCLSSRADWRMFVAYRDPESLEVVERTEVETVDGAYVPKRAP